MSDQTRRSWMVTISQAAVGLGIAGSVESEAINPAGPLPPGVYLPSTSHLSHALMSAERFRPIPPGCPTDYVRSSNAPFQPLSFSGSEFPVIRRLTQLLLGEVSETGTSDDSGVSQEVAEWVDLHVSSAGGVHEAALHLDPLHRAVAHAYYGSGQVDRADKSDAAKICREGLEWISTAVQSKHSGQFLSLQIQQQVELLDSISDDRADKQSENAGTRFFQFLKGDVIRGFYTSREGLKELDFKGNAFYARSPGCDSK